jgi:hypothetical protein
MNREPMFQSAWIKDALLPSRGWRMRLLGWITRRLFGRDYFVIVGRR